MMTPLTISYTDFEPSNAIDDVIRAKVARLEKFYHPIISCHVTLSEPHKRKTKGNIFHIQISLRVAHHELTVNREPEKNHAHETFHVALRDAFDSMERQLKKIHGNKKGILKKSTLPTPMNTGEVIRLYSFEGFGFIKDSAGRELFFSEDNVEGGFNEIKLGDVVYYRENQCDDSGVEATSLEVASIPW